MFKKNYKEIFISLFILVSLTTLIIHYLPENLYTIYCMDELTEQKLQLIKKIDKCKADCLYHKEQLMAATQLMNDLMSIKSQLTETEYNTQFVEVKSAIDDSTTNYKSELRALQYYESKLAKGQYELDSFKTVQKRKAS